MILTPQILLDSERKDLRSFTYNTVTALLYLSLKKFTWIIFFASILFDITSKILMSKNTCLLDSPTDEFL